LGHGSAVHFDALAKNFLLPLLISPLLAAALGVVLYRLLRRRNAKNDCACVVPVEESALLATGVLERTAFFPIIVVAPSQACDNVPTAARWSISHITDRLHVFSAMSICFARGLNDTPKLAALLITAKLFSRNTSVAFIGVVIAIGGVLYARKVAETMSHRITRLDASQGLAANLITATLVLFASKFGLPVSTTHVSVGAIAGVGASGQTLTVPALRNVLLSWVATLPLAAVAAWSVARLI
jgi:inorganic phosphate transporter, PiT family